VRAVQVQQPIGDDMADVTVRRVGDMDAILFGSFKRAGSELGLAAFGMNVLDFPPEAGDGIYPRHDHTHDGQEEVYIAWQGSGVLTVGGEEIPLDSETVARVGPADERTVRAGPEGLRLLVVGGVVGAAYERPDVFRKGAPDPMAGKAPGPISGTIPGSQS
jgi:hypothetical protein